MTNDLTTGEAADLRRTLRHIDDQAPLGSDLNRLLAGGGSNVDRGLTGRRVLAGLATVSVLFGLGTGLWSSRQSDTTAIAAASESAANSTSDAGTLPEADTTPKDPSGDPVDDDAEAPAARVFVTADFPGVTSAVRDHDNEMWYGIAQGHVKRSSDDGLTWETIREANNDFWLVVLGLDGAVLAFRNHTESLDNLVAPGFESNQAPEVHRLAPGTNDEWQVMVLPRPNLPDNVSQPAAEDDGGECPLFGGQSWVKVVAATVGDRVVVLGDHRVVADGVCDESIPFLWVSLDGIDWVIAELHLADGFAVGIDHMENELGLSYVAYGDVRANTSGPFSALRMWTSSDLDHWTDISFNPDHAGLPEEAVVVPSWARVAPGRSIDGQVRLTFPVVEFGRGIDTSIADVDDLERRLAGLGEGPTSRQELEGTLDDLKVTFPLDEGEVLVVKTFFDYNEPVGQLLVTSEPAGTWDFTFVEE